MHHAVLLMMYGHVYACVICAKSVRLSPQRHELHIVHSFNYHKDSKVGEVVAVTSNNSILANTGNAAL